MVNPGSSSRKYALYCDGKVEVELRFEKTNTGFEMCSQVSGLHQTCEAISESDFLSAFSQVVDAVKVHLIKESIGKKPDVVVIRVVAPGTYFQHHSLISDSYIKRLKEKESVAPLHIPVILKEIEAVKKHYPSVKIIAASDSAFHAEMPPKAREYSIKADDASKYDVYRFGYHGLSIASVARRIHSLIGREPGRMIVCHIGNGTSVTAVKEGKSVETTMGFSPSTGLPMGTRAGDVDTAALLELMRVKNFRPREAEMYLNTNGGLLGMSNDSDIRKLLDRRAQKEPVATHALDVFAYNIQKAIAFETVSLGGLDVLVLTATASVRSSELRSIVLQGLSHLGIHINKDKNDLLVGKDGVISEDKSEVKVVVMRTDEMGEMVQVANQLAMQNT